MVTSMVWQIEHQQELLALYGKVCVRWAALDLQMMLILATCLDNYEAARALIMDGTGAGKARIEEFNRVIGGSKLDQGERQALLDIMNRTSSLLSVRNHIVHAPLVTSYSFDGKKLRLSIKQIDRGGKQKPVSIQTIKAHLSHIGKILDELEEAGLALSSKYDPVED
jgi:hypothetical protein